MKDIMTALHNSNLRPYEKLRLAILLQARLDKEALKKGRNNTERYCSKESLDIFYNSDWYEFLSGGIRA